MRIFTTGEVAKLCQCAPRTVVKWCNKGLLAHFHLPGSGRDRRITEDNLRKFLAENEMPPVEELEAEQSVIRIDCGHLTPEQRQSLLDDFHQNRCTLLAIGQQPVV